MKIVTTNKMRFLHLKEDGASNTICGAHPNYYGTAALQEVSEEKISKMYKCRKCFPEGCQ